MRRRAREIVGLMPGLALLALATLALFLGAATTASARITYGIVPLEGEWLGRTSTGLPVSFEVVGKRVTDVHFSFHWGSCGRHDAIGERPTPVPYDPLISTWEIYNPGGEYIAGRFRSPEWLEGRVIGYDFGTVGSSCPRSEENFAAELGRVPTYVKPQAFAIDDRRTGHRSIRPKVIQIRPGLTFRSLYWDLFNQPVAHAAAKAFIRGPHGKLYDPAAQLTFSHLEPDGGPGLVAYKTLSYRMYGPLPHGFPRRGAFTMF